MGCLFFKKQKPQSNYIKIVHMNGHVEHFYYPLTAGEVTGKQPTQFLCAQAQLISGYLKPLKPDTQLEPSHIYFMLSYSTIKSECSPMDIANTAKRLLKLAKTSRPQPSFSSSNRSSTCGSSPGSESPVRSPSRMGVEFGKEGLCKELGSWKPILDTIRESSFNHRTESDLREMHLEIII